MGLPSVEEPFKILRPKKSFSLYMNVLSRRTEWSYSFCKNVDAAGDDDVPCHLGPARVVPP